MISLCFSPRAHSHVDRLDKYIVVVLDKGAGGQLHSKEKASHLVARALLRPLAGERREKVETSSLTPFLTRTPNNSLTERQIPIVQRAHQTGDDWRSRFERTGEDSDTDSEVSALLMGDD